MEYFTFDGTPSTYYNAYLAKSNMFDAPKRDITSVTVPGRNGVLHLDNGRYESFKAKCTVYIPKNMQNTIDELRNFLLSKGSCEYRESWRSGEFRKAVFIDAFVVTESDRQGSVFDLTWECSPERFLDVGDILRSVGTEWTAVNPTQMNAYPLIEVEGTGSLTFGGTTLTLSQNTGTTTIDCEIQDAYEGSINRNPNLTMTNGFPVLVPGNNAGTYTGFTAVRIKPRWWML